MNRMAKLGWILGAVLVAGVVLAGSMVDQGKPGTQGAWPVSLTGGTWTPDGGYIGSVSVVTFDGGSIGSVTTNSGWERIASFDLDAWFTDGGTIPTTQELVFSYDGTSTLVATSRTSGATGAPNALGFVLSDFGGRFQQFRITVSIITATGGSLTGKARIYTDQGVALNETTAGGNDLTSDYTGGTASSLWVWSPQFYVAAPFSTEIHMPLVPFWTFYFSASTGTVTNVAYGQIELWGLH